MIAAHRWLFVATILGGSFLLFLVQPLVARMALPHLGGAPAVWNSAMLVYQALLLAGYTYAHLLARLPVARQAAIHLTLLVLAGLTLPIALVPLALPAAGYEALWVPLLFALSIGPVFFVVSAQAPLMQRWYAADPEAGDPYWLYAASNLGSFAGLLAYPLVFEPSLSLSGQSLAWSVGYGLLVVLVALAALTSRRAAKTAGAPADRALATEAEPIGWRRIALWLALAAVPSGLMLSTTAHLTTDIVAMPLLWVIPLGLYLLSFVFAFNERSALGFALARSGPAILLLAGGMAMVGHGAASLTTALATVVMLFVVAVALHRRLYRDRPSPAQLTLFYLAMSAGGALGGLFTALVAPMLFDWTWEHPLLVLAAAALLPNRPLFPWMERLGLDRRRRRVAVLLVLIAAAALSALLHHSVSQGRDTLVVAAMVAIAGCGLLVLGRRAAFVFVLLLLMLGRGGYDTLQSSFDGARERSFFGVYNVRETAETRELTHGTTLHGLQFTDPLRRRQPTTYYGPDSGVGVALRHAPEVLGENARVGVVGLGVGTLACYAQPGQTWEFIEIDPAILRYSRDGTFTFVRDCTPDAQVHIGDARLVLDAMPADRFDALVLDAFSSDAIPLHLVTREAFAIYDRVVAADGLLLLHISNRFVDLQPMIHALAAEQGMYAVMRASETDAAARTSGSLWVAMSRDPATLARLLSAEKESPWNRLPPAAQRVWTDDFASILPFIVWPNVLGGTP
ncbi:fused MFS/spermidine synthase [Pelagerythrobacter sp.]|uniref:fused MFS/spermidine synthase n=1 Tax=Pelagerythrobacter sp. TaxID=2800702 RepID=UPI0035B23229